MEAQVICHSFPHQHTEQERNKDQGLFGGRGGGGSTEGNISPPKAPGKGICSERPSFPLIALLGNPPTHQPRCLASWRGWTKEVG